MFSFFEKLTELIKKKKRKFLSGKRILEKNHLEIAYSVYGLSMHTNNVEQGIAFMILRIWVEEYLRNLLF